MEKQLDVAVLGCGKMGETIITTLESMEEVRRIVGFDPVESQLAFVTKLHPQVETTTDLDSVLNDSDIKLVYIAANNSNHVPLAIKAMRAGKAVMTEKPSGTTPEEIESLLEVQRETGAFIQVGLECRYSAIYMEAKKIISSGEIGALKNVHYTYSMPPYRKDITLDGGETVPNWRVKRATGGNMYAEKLCHYIDLVRWWNEGSRVDKYVITSAENVIPHFEIEDNVHVSYHFDNGCVAQLFFIMTAAPGHNNDLLGKDDLFDQDRQGHKLNYIITGTEGAIEIDIFQRQLRVYHHPGKPGLTSEQLVRTVSWNRDEGPNGSTDEKVYFHNTDGQNRDIVRRVLNGMPPGLSLEDAQETMRLCYEFTQTHRNAPWTVIER